jgi:putative transposase
MPNYRRNFVPGGAYFFTVVTHRRTPIFDDPRARALLGTAFRECLIHMPFCINAIVLLPDHLHTIWTLPPGDEAYPQRWARIKASFTRNWLASGGREQAITAGSQRDGRRGVLQPRYWEHTIRDESDLARHVEYIHYNPVRHGLVACPRDWPYSSFHRWVRAGDYPVNWGCGALEPRKGPFAFEDLRTTAMELIGGFREMLRAAIPPRQTRITLLSLLGMHAKIKTDSLAIATSGRPNRKTPGNSLLRTSRLMYTPRRIG